MNRPGPTRPLHSPTAYFPNVLLNKKFKFSDTIGIAFKTISLNFDQVIQDGIGITAFFVQAVFHLLFIYFYI